MNILDNYNLVYILDAMQALGYKTDISNGADFRQRLYGNLTDKKQINIAKAIDRSK